MLGTQRGLLIAEKSGLSSERNAAQPNLHPNYLTQIDITSQHQPLSTILNRAVLQDQAAEGCGDRSPQPNVWGLKMARAKPVVLKTISFVNQTQAHAFFQQMLQRYVPGEQVSPEDTVHLAELFKRHPSYAEKIGPGINYFEVIPEKFGSQCFCAVLKNGTKEGFSYKKCVTQKDD